MALILFGAFILGTVLDYVVGVNSSAMVYARQVVLQSRRLPDQVGDVESVDLAKFWGFGQRPRFNGAEVELSLRVSGSRGSVPVLLRLELRGDSWSVISSSVPL